MRIFCTPYNYNSLINVLLAFLLLFPQIAQAQQIEYSSSTAEAIIYAYAAHYGISGDSLYETLKCESNLSPSVIGDHGTSYGVAQIHLPAHKDITKAQALDPMFSIDWAASEFSKGRAYQWTCWKNRHV